MSGKKQTGKEVTIVRSSAAGLEKNSVIRKFRITVADVKKHNTKAGERQ